MHACDFVYLFKTQFVWNQKKKNWRCDLCSSNARREDTNSLRGVWTETHCTRSRFSRVYFMLFLQMFAFWQNAKQIRIYIYRYIYACISICTYMYVYILCVLWLCEYTTRFPSRQPDEWICGLKLASQRATLFSSPHSFYAHTEEKAVETVRTKAQTLSCIKILWEPKNARWYTMGSRGMGLKRLERARE